MPAKNPLIKFQSICHNKNNLTKFKMHKIQNAENLVQALLLLEKSQFTSSCMILFGFFGMRL